MKNTIIVVLIAVIVLLVVALTRQAHKNEDLRRWNESLKGQVTNLKENMNKNESNHVSEATIYPRNAGNRRRSGDFAPQD